MCFEFLLWWHSLFLFESKIVSVTNVHATEDVPVYRKESSLAIFMWYYSKHTHIRAVETHVTLLCVN